MTKQRKNTTTTTNSKMNTSQQQKDKILKINLQRTKNNTKNTTT